MIEISRVLQKAVKLYQSNGYKLITGLIIIYGLQWRLQESFRLDIAILSRLRQNFILKKFWEIEYLTIRKKLK